MKQELHFTTKLHYTCSELLTTKFHKLPIERLLFLTFWVCFQMALNETFYLKPPILLREKILLAINYIFLVVFLLGLQLKLWIVKNYDFPSSEPLARLQFLKMVRILCIIFFLLPRFTPFIFSFLCSQTHLQMFQEFSCNSVITPFNTTILVICCFQFLLLFCSLLQSYFTVFIKARLICFPQHLLQCKY